MRALQQAAWQLKQEQTGWTSTVAVQSMVGDFHSHAPSVYMQLASFASLIIILITSCLLLGFVTHPGACQPHLDVKSASSHAKSHRHVAFILLAPFVVKRVEWFCSSNLLAP